MCYSHTFFIAIAFGPASGSLFIVLVIHMYICLVDMP